MHNDTESRVRYTHTFRLSLSAGSVGVVPNCVTGFSVDLRNVGVMFHSTKANRESKSLQKLFVTFVTFQ